MGTRERRQREVDQRRREILQAAWHLFSRQGYAGTSIPQIAREAELAPGTIYLYFPSKEALYVELSLEGYDILRKRLAEEAQRPAPTAEKVEGLLNVFFSFAHQYPEYYDMIFFLIQRERSGGWEGIFPKEVVARVRVQEQLCKAIADQILEETGVREACRRAETVDAVWSMLSGVIFHFAHEPASAQVMKRAKEVILAGIFSVATKP